MREKVVFFEISPEQQEYFVDHLHGQADLEFHPERLTEENAELIGEANYIVSFIYSDLSQRILDKAKQLKGIATMSVGTDHIDLEDTERRDIVVSNVPAYGPNTVAEHTMALLLAMSRNIVPSVERTRQGIYQFEGLTGWDLMGRTLGIIGTGKIGARVAKAAHGLEMKLIGYDPHPNPDLTKQYQLEYMSIDDVLKKADVITLHVPLTKETKHMLSHQQFAQMKKGMVVLNTARGALIDLDALLAALNDGTVSQAGIDVLEDEGLLKQTNHFVHPSSQEKTDYEVALADHALMRHPKVIVTPHSAFNSKEAVKNILKTTLDNIEGMLKNHHPVNTVNGA